MRNRNPRGILNMDPIVNDFNLFDGLFSPAVPTNYVPIAPTEHIDYHAMDAMDAMQIRKRKSTSLEQWYNQEDEDVTNSGSFNFESYDDESFDSDIRQFTRMKSMETQSLSSTGTGNERQNHSEIEKRRRDKMNAYITELSSMLPMCNAMNRKLDKLTVLRMAVQHLKSLRGATTSIPEARPSFLSEDELKQLVLEAAEGFLFVVSCDRARILYVSESVRNVLSYLRSDLIGQSLFDYLHPRDINKVKEQLSSSDLSPRERLIDARTMMPVKTELPQRPTHLCSGARRSFFCHMRCGNKSYDGSPGMKAEKESDIDMCHRKKKSDRKNYTVIHCTGYLKSWPSSKMDIREQEESDDNCNLSCLVAIGQIKTPFDPKSVDLEGVNVEVRPVEYISRHSVDGKFTYIDQAATVLLGYLPQELLGTSIYEFYHQEDIAEMAETHRKVLRTKEKLKTNVYRFKSKDGSFIHIRSVIFSFRNPWTKDVEYVVSRNTVVPVQEVSSSGQALDAGNNTLETDTEASWDGNEESRSGAERKQQVLPGEVPGTRLGAGRIGRQIAEELLETQRVDTTNMADSTNPVPSASACASTKADLPKTRNGIHTSIAAAAGVVTTATSRNGICVNTCGTDATCVAPGAETSLIENVIAEQQSADEQNNQGNDGNDEAAMSIIMSLLEADAGLGGPIDFNDLPWPL